MTCRGHWGSEPREGHAPQNSKQWCCCWCSLQRDIFGHNRHETNPVVGRPPPATRRQTSPNTHARFVEISCPCLSAAADCCWWCCFQMSCWHSPTSTLICRSPGSGNPYVHGSKQAWNTWWHAHAERTQNLIYLWIFSLLMNDTSSPPVALPLMRGTLKLMAYCKR